MLAVRIKLTQSTFKGILDVFLSLSECNDLINQSYAFPKDTVQAF